LWLSGVQTLVFLAGLQKRDPAVIEAAAVDGASPFESFFLVTLPLLFPLMIVNVIYTTVLYMGLSNNGLIALISDLIFNLTYGRAYASSVAWLALVVQLGCIGIYVLFIKLIMRRYE
jgi:ABC-type sugar transport system permease subunit